MTDKSFCPAVKDLLPLYEDGALSRETEELVSGHLRQCGACRAYYEEMKGEEPIGRRKLKRGCGTERLQSASITDA